MAPTSIPTCSPGSSTKGISAAAWTGTIDRIAYQARFDQQFLPPYIADHCLALYLGVLAEHSSHHDSVEL